MTRDWAWSRCFWLMNWHKRNGRHKKITCISSLSWVGSRLSSHFFKLIWTSTYQVSTVDWAWHEPWAFLVGSKTGIHYNGLLKINPREIGIMSFPHIPPKQTNEQTNKPTSKQTKSCLFHCSISTAWKTSLSLSAPLLGLHASTDLIKVQIFDQMNHLRQGREINDVRKTMHLWPSEFLLIKQTPCWGEDSC